MHADRILERDMIEQKKAGSGDWNSSSVRGISRITQQPAKTLSR